MLEARCEACNAPSKYWWNAPVVAGWHLPKAARILERAFFCDDCYCFEQYFLYFCG